MQRVPIALLAALFWQFSAPVAAQSTSELLTDPTSFEIAYAMSYIEYDACGDSEAGRIFRRAIIEKLELCPFSPQAMNEFQRWRIETLEGMAAELWQAQSKGIRPNGPPELSGGTASSCAEYREMPRYQSKRASLLRYDRGEIDVDDVIGEECPSGPASL